MNTTISQRGAWGDAWQMNERITNPMPSNDERVRQSYNASVTEAYAEFVKKAKAFHDNEQCFGEDLAREAFDLRHAIKEAHQARTSFIGRVGIFMRNLLTYGAANATFESLSKKKTPEELAYSAFKTDGGDMSLAGNGFADILGTWYAIKDISTLYPEDITPEMVAAFKAQPLDRLDPELILLAYGSPAAVTQARAQAKSQVQKLVDDFLSNQQPQAAPVLSKSELLATVKPAHHRDFASYM